MAIGQRNIIRRTPDLAAQAPAVIRLLLPLVLLCARGLFAQSASFHSVDSFPIPAAFFAVDRLLQLYVADSSGLITKYTPQGKTQFDYSNRPLGPPALVDATDPFNVLLYYPEYQTIILLDRTLAPTGELSLLSLGMIDVQLAAMGNDLHIWLYDQAAFKLYKVNPQGKISLESGDLSLALPRPPRPARILVQNNFVYLYDPEQGLHQFDIFGQYLRTIDIKKANDVQFIGSKIAYLEDDDQLGLYDPASFQFSSIDLPNTIWDFRWQKGLLYGLGRDKILVWKWVE